MSLAALFGGLTGMIIRELGKDCIGFGVKRETNGKKATLGIWRVSEFGGVFPVEGRRRR